MKASVIGILCLFVLMNATNAESTETVAITKAVELGVHRIERLVTLRKIDPMFINSLYAMKAERTNDPAMPFKVYGFAQPDANNQASTISMSSDPTGKVLSHNLSAIFQPANPAQWPEADSATLMEDALHFVLEGWVRNPEVKPYYLGLKEITLTPRQDQNGKMIAEFSVSSEGETKVLWIKLKTDGTFISYEIK